MSTTETALTAHLVMPEGCPGDGFLAHVGEELHHHFNIDQATLQVGNRGRAASLPLRA